MTWKSFVKSTVDALGYNNWRYIFTRPRIYNLRQRMSHFELNIKGTPLTKIKYKLLFYGSRATKIKKDHIIYPRVYLQVSSTPEYADLDAYQSRAMYEMVESTVYTIYTARIDIARSSVGKS